MNPVTTQLLISIVTILGSGVVSAIVSHYFTVTRAEREFKRKKLEEMFLALHKYCTSIASQNIVWPAVMRGELTYNQALDANIKGQDYAIGHFEIVEMLVNIYFSELRPDFDNILLCLARIKDIKEDFTKSYKNEEQTESFIKPLNEALLVLAKVEEMFKKRIVEIAQKMK